MGNKKAFVVISVLAIAIAIPLTLRSASQTQETQSRAAEPAQTVQTQTNELGTVTTGTSSVDLSQTNPTPAPKSKTERYYVLSTVYDGLNCWTKKFDYKVNGLRLTWEPGDFSDQTILGNYCITTVFKYVKSSSNCNTFSMIAPSGYHNVGIGYKKIGPDVTSGMQTFKYEMVASKTLCDANYLVTFGIRTNQ